MNLSNTLTSLSLFNQTLFNLQNIGDLWLKSKSSVYKADLTGYFSEINLPSDLQLGSSGSVQVIVKNQGTAIARGPVTVKLYLSTDGKIDANDVLVASQTRDISLGVGRSLTFDLTYQNVPSAIAVGSYQLIAQIDSENTINERNENNNTISETVSSPNVDMVIKWNAIALNAIQAEGVAGRGIPPTTGSRLLAILSTAIHDTVQAFENTFTPYAIDTVAPEKTCLETAVAGAAYQVLSTLIPQQISLFRQQLNQSILEIDDRPSDEIKGVKFGQKIANQILTLRANDGANFDPPYDPPSGDYIWQPDPPNYTVVGQKWGKVTPWSIGDPENFAPDGLDGTPTKDFKLYIQEIEEVRHLGGKNDTDITTITRTPDQTEIAFFWAYDRPDTFRPYGHLNQITQTIALNEGNSLAENARLFAALNVALADAAIVAWNEKYKYKQPRPDDVIAGGIAEKDDLMGTVSDPDWEPLLSPTPPFPDYISGHSTFAGAWAGVLTNIFGENYAFSAVSQELPGVIRSFDSFEDAAYENAISRVYGGVHVREATITDALPTGLEIGKFVSENLFQPMNS
jgi:hypothetical protein